MSLDDRDCGMFNLENDERGIPRGEPLIMHPANSSQPIGQPVGQSFGQSIGLSG
ncbi:hypothetical protein SMMN14_09735 [Sphaerulina musiva]